MLADSARKEADGVNVNAQSVEPAGIARTKSWMKPSEPKRDLPNLVQHAKYNPAANPWL